MSIPKIIHYTWFGNGEMPKRAKKCLKSWKKHMPDYKFMLWNEENFNVNLNRYVKEAYENKRYMYVSDYCRLQALYNYGGIYMDVDCKAYKSFDALLPLKAFTGVGYDEKEITACTIGAEKGNKIIGEILDIYDKRKFVLEDGSFDLKSINILMKEVFISYGYQEKNEQQQVEDFTIFPREYFCPTSMFPDLYKNRFTKNTFVDTAWDADWVKRRNNPIRRFLRFIKYKVLRRK